MLLYRMKFKRLFTPSVFLTFLSLLLQSTWAQQPTLHAIIVADTKDTQIGALKDEEDMKKLVDEIAQNTCLQKSVTLIDGDSVTRNGRGYDKVKSAIGNLPVAPNDVVLFYYSGHGANPEDTKSRWPGLGVEGQTTPRKRWIELAWVRETLQKKNPRFFIAMADACNVFFSEEVGSRGSSHRGVQQSAYEQLFLGYKGYIIASSSIPGQISLGGTNTGGFFTQQFLKSLYEGLSSPNPDWEQIMTQATQGIEINQPKQKMQNPQADISHAIKSEPRDEFGKGICAAPPDPPDPVPTPIIPDDEHPLAGTCNDNVSYIGKDGKPCCKDRNGKEHCFND